MEGKLPGTTWCRAPSASADKNSKGIVAKALACDEASSHGLFKWNQSDCRETVGQAAEEMMLMAPSFINTTLIQKSIIFAAS